MSPTHEDEMTRMKGDNEIEEERKRRILLEEVKWQDYN